MSRRPLALLVAVLIGALPLLAPSADSSAATGALSHDAVREVVCAEGYAWHCETAMYVAWRESSYRPDAYNTGCRCVGLFQIAGVHGYRFDELVDPYFNTAVAYGLWLDRGWRPWPWLRGAA